MIKNAKNHYPTLFMRCIILLALINFNLPKSFAQQNFVEGYIVLNTRDTLKGWIDNSKPGKNFQRCNFIQEKGKPVQPYLPNQLLGYGLMNGQRYETFAGASGHADYFAEQILLGKASLLYNGKIFFLKKDNAVHSLPIPYEKTIVSGTRSFSKRISSFVDTLQHVLNDCPALVINNKASYGYRSLRNVILKYNQCTGSKTLEFDQQPWLKTDFKVGLALTQSQLKLTPAYFPEFGNGSFDKSMQVGFGGGVSLSSPRTFGPLHLSIEAWWLKNNFHGRSTVVSSTSKYHYELFTEASSVKLPIGLKYYLNKKLFIGAGYSLEYLINAKSYGTQEIESANVVTTNDISIYSFRKSINGYWASIGITQKVLGRFSAFAEFRFDRNSGYFGPGPSNLSQVTAFSFMVGTQF